ncbi:hypothetical protein L249_7236 [Ophiocordyceps polyrhachis-furcata BCC 54312]|uniref:Nitrogen regulatory protein areA GATA-like domain-containing protein n=1 Tax=Ophiocordyceps polyrhachis-furcata BCC 54312 TaxID=1330021 RepID=A0A367LAQ8_9HYPO|nr:hypothetical protein L249_7236 [Ophiocordyceps polyrhachis-furcata BCC 54312]
MAAVLSSADDCGYFGPLRRSRSQSNFAVDSSPTHHYSPSPSPSFYVNFYPESDLSSSPPTVQAESTDDGSFSSTPTSNLSVASDSEELPSFDNCPDDDPFDLPLLSQEKFFIQPEVRDAEKLELSPKTAGSCTPPAAPDTPVRIEHAQDDCAATNKPSRQVDYLSHDWTEEDIWSSWRYVISKRGSQEFPNCQRLENACWRTWSKVKNGLKTISPEELNWLKDCDVTWLYGPLQTGSSRLQASRTESCSRSLSNSESLVNLAKKPILKKRSMSEMMLQRSLTSSSLLKQATAAVQAQETSAAVLRPTMARAMTDCYLALPLCSRQSSQSQETNMSLAASTDSSGISSPCTERKHIHFNEQVEQCIAVEVKCDDDDDDDDRGAGPYDSDSDDGVVMKRIKPKRRAPSMRRRASKTTQTEGKTIAMLPSTKLKYREDASESRMTHAAAGSPLLSPSSPLLSPSSSQETLRPSRQASVFYFDGDDYDDDSIHVEAATTSDERATQDRLPQRSPSSSASLYDEPPVVGMRRTWSGMLMPCEDDEPRPGDGILGRVLDTVNTARDIAHVIWNVGWRR